MSSSAEMRSMGRPVTGLPSSVARSCRLVATTAALPPIEASSPVSSPLRNRTVVVVYSSSRVSERLEVRGMISSSFALPQYLMRAMLACAVAVASPGEVLVTALATADSRNPAAGEVALSVNVPGALSVAETVTDTSLSPAPLTRPPREQAARVSMQHGHRRQPWHPQFSERPHRSEQVQ